jgi:hypothetical protein
VSRGCEGAWRLNGAPPPSPAAPTARLIRPASWSVAVPGFRRPVRRRTLLRRSGELLKSSGRLEQLVAVDVRVASHGREVGVAEVLGDEAGVATLLAQPGRGGVAQRVGGDVRLDPGSRRGAPDDVGEDRLLQASAGEPAEDRIGRLGLPGVAQLPQLAGEASRDRLTPGLVALPVADEERPPASVEFEVAPLERTQLGATKAGGDEGEQRELVALREPGEVPVGLPGGVEQPPELLARQPVALLPRLRRRVQVPEGVGPADASADPAEKAAQEEEAAVVSRRCRVCSLLVGAQVVDDRRFLEDAAMTRLRPVE